MYYGDAMVSMDTLIGWERIEKATPVMTGPSHCDV